LKKNEIENLNNISENISKKEKNEISILNRNNEKEIIQFVSDEMLETIQIGDSTV